MNKKILVFALLFTVIGQGALLANATFVANAQETPVVTSEDVIITSVEVDDEIIQNEVISVKTAATWGEVVQEDVTTTPDTSKDQGVEGGKEVVVWTLDI
ncbi:MAG: hypothetical protein ACK5K7_07325 [Bacilli bacterium]